MNCAGHGSVSDLRLLHSFVSFPSPAPLPAGLSPRAWSLAPGLAHSTSDVSEQPGSLPHHVTCCCTLSTTHKHDLHGFPLSALVPTCNTPAKQRA